MATFPILLIIALELSKGQLSEPLSVGAPYGFIAKISAPAIPPTQTITLVANAEGDVPTIAI